MLLNGYICNALKEKRSDGKPSVFIKELLIRALTKSPGVSTSGLSSFQALHPLHTPLTTISTCSEIKPLGSFMAGIATPSRHIVLPQE